MAEVTNTVGPAGMSPDYTSLADWAADALADINPFQTALCFTGADLGEVWLSNPITSPDSTNHYTIRSNDLSNRHNLRNNLRGAYLTSATNNGIGIGAGMHYTEVIGMTILVASGNNSYAAIKVVSTSGTLTGVKLLKNLIIGESSAGGTGINFYANDANIASALVANNAVMCHKIIANGITVEGEDTGTSTTITIEIYYNTVNRSNGNSYAISGEDGKNSSTINLTMKNNIGLDYQPAASTADFRIDSSLGTKTYSNNMSSDASAPGANSITGTTSSKQFIGPDTDLRLREGASAVDAAITVASVTDDALDTSRPIGSAPDMGCFEGEVPLPRIPGTVTHGPASLL